MEEIIAHLQECGIKYSDLEYQARHLCEGWHHHLSDRAEIYDRLSEAGKNHWIGKAAIGLYPISNDPLALLIIESRARDLQGIWRLK